MLAASARVGVPMEQFVVSGGVRTEMAAAVLETIGLPVHNAILSDLAHPLALSGPFLLLRPLLPVRRPVLSVCRNFHRRLSHRRAAHYILDIA